MFATAKGYYNGFQIVLDSPARLEKRQEVVVTYIVQKPFDDKQAKESADSIVDSLDGVIHDTGKSLEEYRSERLEKYADFD